MVRSTDGPGTLGWQHFHPMGDFPAEPWPTAETGAGRAETRSHSRVATILFPSSHPEPPASPPRLLVVDDNDAFRESLVALLVSGGIEVVAEVSSGREALEVAARLDPDVVLMDVR